MLKVCLVHNYYQQPGGEDQVFAAETDLLQRRGHPVVRFTMHNDQVERLSSLALAKATAWHSAAYRELRHLLRRTRPDVVHFHNTLPLVSPAAYYAARAEGAAVVQTLHNYRLICPGSLLYREGQLCETCVKRRLRWPGVLHACYRKSTAASGAVAAMLALHQAIGTWSHAVDAYIALTEFAREKFIEGGLPAEKLVVKPNFMNDDPGVGTGAGGFALFAGRLAPEKGVETLLSAWERHAPGLPLKIVGDGPLSPVVGQRARAEAGITWLGRQSHKQVLALMQQAALLIFPSTWYEGLPMTIVEAYAVGLPVVASDLGAMSSLVEHERTGLLFQPGQAQDLSAKVRAVVEAPALLARLRREARAVYEVKYTAERNYAMLMSIYDMARSYARVPAYS